MNAWISCYKLNKDQKSCPSGCKEALVELVSQLGCCYRSIYYGDVFLDFMFIDEEVSIEEGEAFDILASGIWERCGVPLISKCLGDPFKQN